MLNELLRNTEVPTRRRERSGKAESPRRLALIEAARQGRPVVEIAKECGVNYSTVYRWLRQHYA